LGMKAFFTLAVASVVLLSGCSHSYSEKEVSDNAKQALSFAKDVCDGTNELNWNDRAKLAAQANYLDKRWERLADAAYVQAANSLIVEMVKKGKNYADYPEPALAKVYESQVQYAKFLAECSILELDKD